MQPRVLIVDGYRDAADTLAFLLNTQGFEARAAYGAREALEVVRSWLPAAVILDIRLPVMSGHDVATEIRREVVPCPIFIAVTGYHDPELPKRSHALGFAAHFTKPCDPAAICGILRPSNPARAA